MTPLLAKWCLVAARFTEDKQYKEAFGNSYGNRYLTGLNVPTLEQPRLISSRCISVPKTLRFWKWKALQFLLLAPKWSSRFFLWFFCCRFLAILQGRKRAQTQTLWFGYLRVGWGSSTWSGGGQKVRYVLRKPGKPNFLAGYPGNFAGMSGGARKVREKKFVFNYGP